MLLVGCQSQQKVEQLTSSQKLAKAKECIEKIKSKWGSSNDASSIALRDLADARRYLQAIHEEDPEYTESQELDKDLDGYYEARVGANERKAKPRDALSEVEDLMKSGLTKEQLIRETGLRSRGMTEHPEIADGRKYKDIRK